MKNILLILTIAFFATLAIALKQNNSKYEKAIQLHQMHLIQMQNEINVKDSVIIDLYEPIVRLQLACGIKNPDTTFTYIEKVLNPCNIHKLIKTDLR